MYTGNVFLKKNKKWFAYLKNGKKVKMYDGMTKGDLILTLTARGFHFASILAESGYGKKVDIV